MHESSQMTIPESSDEYLNTLPGPAAHSVREKRAKQLKSRLSPNN